jgi:hypothetical protein
MPDARLQRAFSVSIVMLILSAASAAAQVTFTPGTHPPDFRFPAGPDFATDVLGDPWDFSNAEDISPNPEELGGWVQSEAARTTGTAAAFLQGGVFRGLANATALAAAELSLFDRGTYGAVNPIDRGGVRFPIPTARYKKLAVRVTYGSGAVGQPASAVWFFYPKGHPSETGGVGTKIIGASELGTRTHVLDLTSEGPGEGPAWGSQPFVRGLRVRPLNGGNVVDISIDWVRLTAGDADAHAAKMFVNVSCAGDWTVVALDSANPIFETPLHTGTSSAANVAVNYGVLPPGAYQLALRCNGNLLPGLTPFTVNAPGLVKVTSPGLATSEDFAETHLANGAWDMAQAGDIAGAANVEDASFVPSPSGQDYRARNIGVPGHPFTHDPQVYLLGDSNNRIPVATNRYRYLTYTLTVEGEFDRVLGSRARVVWSPASSASNRTSTFSEAILAWPGRQTYTIDLARLSATVHPIEGRTISADCLPECPVVRTWAERSARFIRIDPHEFMSPRFFQLGAVRLTATPEVPVGGTFVVRYRNEDATFQNGDTHVVRLFADTDTDPTNPGIELTNPSNPITLFSPSAPAEPDRTFEWIVPEGFPPGTYYIYAQITDNPSGSVRGFYSDVPVRVFQPPTSTAAVTIVQPAADSTALTPFTIAGCAAKPDAPGNSGVDDILVTVTGGDDVAPGQRGVTLALGEAAEVNPELGAKQVNIACPRAPDQRGDVSSLAFAQSGFVVTPVYGLSSGHWTLRVLARDAIDGRFSESSAQFVVRPGTNPATNLRLLGTSGNTVAVAWDPPSGGFPLTGYRIEVSGTEAFSSIAAELVVPPTTTSGSGPLPDGVWFVRVVSLGPSGAPADPSNVIGFSLPGGGPPQPPGSPTLTATQVAANPVTLSWTPGAGGSPSSYTLHAGTAPGASDLIVVPLGTATSITAHAPLGTRVFVRIVAANGLGSATSNEIDFEIAAPQPPAAPVLDAAAVNGRNVTLSWTPGGGVAAQYGVLARLSPAGPIVVVLPVSSQSLTVTAPPGTYYVTVVAANAAGVSAESNQIVVNVP